MDLLSKLSVELMLQSELYRQKLYKYPCSLTPKTPFRLIKLNEHVSALNSESQKDRILSNDFLILQLTNLLRTVCGSRDLFLLADNKILRRNRLLVKVIRKSYHKFQRGTFDLCLDKQRQTESLIVSCEVPFHLQPIALNLNKANN